MREGKMDWLRLQIAQFENGTGRGAMYCAFGGEEGRGYPPPLFVRVANKGLSRGKSRARVKRVRPCRAPWVPCEPGPLAAYQRLPAAGESLGSRDSVVYEQ